MAARRLPRQVGPASLRALVALVGILSTLGGLGGARAQAAPVSIAVDRATLTRPLPAGFLGLALEYSTVPAWVGDASTTAGVDPTLVGLLHNLDPAGHAVLRIGGQSTDRTWWPVPHLPRPVGVTYSLRPSWTRAARLLAQRIDGRLVLSLNLEADSPRVSQFEADHLVDEVGRRWIADLEIGNEADLYTVTPWYRALGSRRLLWYLHAGTPVFARPPDYDEADFIAEVQRTMKIIPDLPIAGPDAVNTNWLSGFGQLVAPHGRIGLLDSHAYALLQCVTDPGSRRFPSIPNLLAPSAAADVLNGAQPYIALAHQDGIPFRIDEMGSVSCNGRAGVSNTMASALWVTDALFHAVRSDVDGVNLHSFPGSTNGLFDIADGAGGWTATVHPLYYGALMFAQADPVGARLLNVAAASPQLRTWATIGTDHRVRVLIINDGADAVARIHAPAGFGSKLASVERLLAPGVAATTGVTLGGQSFGATHTGLLAAPTPQSATPGRRGYTVKLPAGSETLLTLRDRTGG